MKKRTKKILSGALALCVLLSTPAGMEAAEAAGQTGSFHTGLQQDTGISQVISGDTSEVISDNSSEDLSGETASEDETEGRSECVSEEAPDDGLNDNSNDSSDGSSKNDTKPAIKKVQNEIHEIISETENVREENAGTESRAEMEQAASNGIKVRNSSLCDSDFYIELTKDGETRRYPYDAWLTYLESCDGWVSGDVEVKLSDTGKEYFDSVRVEEQEEENAPGKRRYTFWAENSDINASTKDVEDGTRSYIAGKDTDSPLLKVFCSDSGGNECFEPTKTDAEQYYADNLTLRGTFCDDASGVSRIEYTADWRAGETCVWTEAEDGQHTGEQETDNCMRDFQITLSDGCYPAIAVRAYDKAGNVSEVKQFVNDAGEPVKIVVDRTAPVLKFDMSAEGEPYNGENEHWTNKDVRIAVSPDGGSCPYAGVYQYEYTYVKIGENMTDVPEEWTELPVTEESSAELVITEDKNGYYLFRAVSRSGVGTAEDAGQRVLIQHQLAEPKPILVSGADETKRKNDWYNRQSGTPEIRFEYPDYDTGAVSKEYDAPVTIHYELTRQESVPVTPGSGASDGHATDGAGKTAVIGVMSCNDVTITADGSKEFVLKKDDLNRHVVTFGCEDGYYTLEYWITDAAGNESEKQIHSYKVDCHAPTDLTMELAGSDFAVGEESVITYKRFYSDTVSCSAAAEYGISGKGSLGIQKVKKIGEWKGGDGSADTDSISIAPNTRCFLYVRAEDEAGNVAEGWTNGIVVDNMAPDGTGDDRELIIEPKGANAHGFFNRDVEVEISVRDAPEDDNCAALQSVTSAVGKDGIDTDAGKELFSFTKEAPTEDEIIAASGFQGKQLVDAAANESNEAYIEVTAADRSGNTKTSMRLLKIDITKPEIEIRFDNNDAENGNYYRAGRTATFHVHELNFDPYAVRVTVTKDGEPFEAALSGWTNDGQEHYATLAFVEDGVYSIAADCTDLADNTSDTVQSEPFIIDRTAPEMTMELTSGQEPHTADGGYFNTRVTAVVTVEEHNFRAEDFIINMAPVSGIGVWSHEGDIHILRIPFEGDGLYHIDCAYTDIAGNPAIPAGEDFIIDTVPPVIAIDGVGNGSANSGAVLPVVSVSDPHIEVSDIAISVRTGRGGTVENAIAAEPVNDEDCAGYRLTLTDMTEKPDDVYYLGVSACDRAGNSAELVYRFSLNRTGSVYDLTSLVHLMERHYTTYGDLDDIQIVEMNIDRIEEFELYVSRNGAIGFRADYTREIGGSADTGYTYTYRVGKENFAGEGIYRLTMYSRDRAGNEVNNTMDIHGQEITFVVDNTAPKVIFDGIASGKVYDVEEQEVHVAITDNFKLTEAELTLVNKANEVLERWDYMELAGEEESLKITIPQHNETVSLLYRVKDAAGNEMQTFQGERTETSDFLVTTDKYVQFVNKPAQTVKGRIIIFVAVMSVLTVLSAITLLCRRKKGNH